MGALRAKSPALVLKQSLADTAAPRDEASPVRGMEQYNAHQRMDQHLKYDVAFSFLANDEPLARNIHDSISGRLTSFIYSERQLDLPYVGDLTDDTVDDPKHRFHLRG